MINKIFNFKYNKSNPSVNEWSNSIYSFNKNNLNTMWNSKIIFNLIKNYFNIKPNNIASSNNTNTAFSLKRIFVSIPEIKSSLNNTNILVYVFNKEKFIINKKLIKLQKMQSNKRIKPFNSSSFTNKRTFSSLSNKKQIYNTNKSFINLNKLYSNFIYAYFKPYKNIIQEKFSNNYKIVTKLYYKTYEEYNNMDLSIVNKRNYKNNFIKSENFINIMKTNLRDMRIIMKRKYYVLFLYKRYITRIYFNKLKFNSINIFNLNKILFKIYNKRVNISIVDLKYLYLDNSVYIDAIVRKLRKRNRNVLRVLRKALILPKIPRIDSMFLLKRKEEINNVLYDIKNYIDINNISKIIFESLKNMHVVGIRLEGKGRLTRRLTASRAVHKKAYKGNLKNVYSSFKGLSTLMTKGSNKSNLNYINLNSYNRNGSYGIKSWQNTM